MRAQKSRKCVSERVSESECEKKWGKSHSTADMKKFFRLVFLTTFDNFRSFRALLVSALLIIIIIESLSFLKCEYSVDNSFRYEQQ